MPPISLSPARRSNSLRRRPDVDGTSSRTPREASPFPIGIPGRHHHRCGDGCRLSAYRQRVGPTHSGGDRTSTERRHGRPGRLHHFRSESLGGTITGVVTDAAYQPIASASVQLTQAETGRRRNVVTDAQGGFTISNLPPGEYRIEAEREGYRKHAQAVSLPLNQEMQIEIPLLPGQRTETVQVTAARGLLRTETAALGGVIDNRQITGLPLDGRNFFELSLLLPGVVPAAPGSAGSARGDFAININGAREDSNNFVLDGVFNGDPKLNGTGVTPPVDAVREFEVATSTYDAFSGRNAGGQMNEIGRASC